MSGELLRVQRKTISKLSEERANVRDQAAIASRIASDRSRRWYKFNWTNHKAKKKHEQHYNPGLPRQTNQPMTL